jgi:hypothetical protein
MLHPDLAEIIGLNAATFHGDTAVPVVCGTVTNDQRRATS